MKNSKKPIGNREKAMVHIAKEQLGMSEDAYRGMLASVGVASARDLDQQGFDEVMQRLRSAGFNPVHKSAKRSGMDKKPPKNKESLFRGIEYLLTKLELPWAYADGVAKRMFGADRLRFCNPDQTYKVMQALIMHCKRREKAGKQGRA
jgi:phage gp16-like protein